MLPVFKHGMMPWHNKNCEMEFRGEVKDTRSYWCSTHNQWACEKAVKVIYVFTGENEMTGLKHISYHRVSDDSVSTFWVPKATANHEIEGLKQDWDIDHIWTYNDKGQIDLNIGAVDTPYHECCDNLVDQPHAADCVLNDEREV